MGLARMGPGHHPSKVLSHKEHPRVCRSNSVNTHARLCLAGLKNGVHCESTLVVEGEAGVDSYKAYFSKYFFIENVYYGSRCVYKPIFLTCLNIAGSE